MPTLVETEILAMALEYAHEYGLVVVNKTGDWAVLSQNTGNSILNHNDYYAETSKGVDLWIVDDPYSKEEVKEMFESIETNLKQNGSKLKDPDKVKDEVVFGGKIGSDSLIIFPDGEWAYVEYGLNKYRSTTDDIKFFIIDSNTSIDELIKSIESN